MQSLSFLGFPSYSVTKDGKVYSHKSNRFLTGYINYKHHDTYTKVTIGDVNKKLHTKSIHRLVAYSFLTKPFDKNVVNHKDGDKNNNDISNLEWVTVEENNEHSMKYLRKGQFHTDSCKNLTKNGEVKTRGIGRYKMTEEEAFQYCKYMQEGYRACDIVVLMNINRKMFTLFRNLKHPKYNYVAEQFDFSNIPTPLKITEDQVIDICKRLENGEKVMSIYKDMNIGRNIVRDIKNRKTYLELSKDYNF